MLALGGFVSDLPQFTLGLADTFLDTLVVIEGHVPADLGLALRSGLPGLLRRIDEVHHLDVAEALDRLRRVHADFAATIMFNWHFITRNHLHFNKNEGNSATLILERYVHVLRPEALFDGLLDFHVTLNQPLQLYCLLDDVLKFGHFCLDTVLCFINLSNQLLMLLIKVLIDVDHSFLAIGVLSSPESNLLSHSGVLGNSLFLLASCLGFLVRNIIKHGLQLVRQELVVVHVEGDLLPLLCEDTTGEEHIEGVIDTSPQVLYALAIKLFLGQNFLVTPFFTGFEE